MNTTTNEVLELFQFLKQIFQRRAERPTFLSLAHPEIELLVFAFPHCRFSTLFVILHLYYRQLPFPQQSGHLQFRIEPRHHEQSGGKNSESGMWNSPFTIAGIHSLGRRLTRHRVPDAKQPRGSLEADELFPWD